MQKRGGLFGVVLLGAASCGDQGAPSPVPPTSPPFDAAWRISTHNSYWVDHGVKGDVFASGTALEHGPGTRGLATILFTDVEGSTRLLQERGDGYAGVLAEHRRVLHEAFASHGGVEVDSQGDAFFVAFARASDALAAELQAHVKDVTAPYKYPRIVDFAADLPKTTSGKVRRALLRRQ